MNVTDTRTNLNMYFTRMHSCSALVLTELGRGGCVARLPPSYWCGLLQCPLRLRCGRNLSCRCTPTGYSRSEHSLPVVLMVQTVQQGIGPAAFAPTRISPFTLVLVRSIVHHFIFHSPGILTDRYSRSLLLCSFYLVRATAYVMLLKLESQVGFVATTCVFGLGGGGVVVPVVQPLPSFTPRFTPLFHPPSHTHRHTHTRYHPAPSYPTPPHPTVLHSQLSPHHPTPTPPHLATLRPSLGLPPQ